MERHHAIPLSIVNWAEHTEMGRGIFSSRFLFFSFFFLKKKILYLFLIGKYIAIAFADDVINDARSADYGGGISDRLNRLIRD